MTTTARQIRVCELLAAVKANEEFEEDFTPDESLERQWHEAIIPASIRRAMLAENLNYLDEQNNATLDELCIVYKLAYMAEINRIQIEQYKAAVAAKKE